VRRATAVVASLKTPSSTTHFARETDQPCRRKSAHCLGKNCVVSSQIVAEFCSAEIGVDPLFRLTRIRDANDYAQVTQALEPLLVLARETRAHVLCVHHAGKADREGGDGILGSTAIFAAVDTALIMKKTDRYRTLQSQQRYGVDLDETVLYFDTKTRTISLGDSREKEEGKRIKDAMLDCLQTQEQDQERGHALTEAELSEEVEGKTTYKRTALRELVQADNVDRLGKGGRGDPYRYAVKNSRFRVPTIDGVQGNKHPKMAVDPQQSFLDTCSQDFQTSVNGRNKHSGSGTSMHLLSPHEETSAPEEVF
jgi:hypothetical protein